VARWRSVPEWRRCGSYLLIRPREQKRASELVFRVFRGLRTGVD
jgi:hypothetical protein